MNFTAALHRAFVLPIARTKAASPPVESPSTVKARVERLSLYYGDFRALEDVDLPVHEHSVTALIGPSGCGKSTLLRAFNRMHDLYDGIRYQGAIRLFPTGINILDAEVDPIDVRMRIGMVFQKPNPFPKSIYENVAYGQRVRGVKRPDVLDEHVEKALRQAGLWDEVKDKLGSPGTELSGGQQQRLCIARCLAAQPEILLFDEPTSALDPVATANIEELVRTLRNELTILIVTHNMQQAARVSDYTAYMYLGKVVEFDRTERIFTNPRHRGTEDYITGRFG